MVYQKTVLAKPKMLPRIPGDAAVRIIEREQFIALWDGHEMSGLRELLSRREQAIAQLMAWKAFRALTDARTNN